jgi:hypothetical protein
VAGLWGLKAIAKALDTSEKTVVRWYWNENLPLLRRRKGRHPRPIWWVPEEMLMTWLMVKAKLDREELRERRKARASAENGRESVPREGTGTGR